MTEPAPLDDDVRANAADSLLGIPSARPGQNVFAQRSIAQHRHLLQSNFAYQDAYLEKHQLPHESIPPAFRKPGLSLDTSLPMPAPSMPASDNTREQPRRFCDSSVTTMSQFMDAGKQSSPEINLATTPDMPAEPTWRGYVEERAEQRKHQASGSNVLRIPVYHPSPKVSSEGYAVPETTEKAKQEVKFGADTVHQYAPKKKPRFFDRLRSGKRVQDAISALESGSRIPVKAEAVLGTKQPFTAPPRRTNSKKTGKSFFSHRNSDATTDDATTKMNEPSRPSTSMGFSGSSSSFLSWTSSKRVNSRADPEAFKQNNTPRVTRTQSLKYFDAVAPPTPPLKDTPPDVKVIRHANEHTEAIVPFSNLTPTHSTGFLSVSSRLSPTKLGRYATRSGTRIVTQPSMHSLHASVHMDSLSQEVKDGFKHMDALGIAGYNDEPPIPPYTPSAYSQMNSPEARSSVAHFPSTIHEHESEDLEATPQAAIVEKPREPRRSSLDTEETTCTSGTIQICRDFERDESIVDFMRYDEDSIFSSPNNTRAKAQSKLYHHIDHMLKNPGEMPDYSPPPKEALSPRSLVTRSAQVSPLRARRGVPAADPTTPEGRGTRDAINRSIALEQPSNPDKYGDSPTLKGSAMTNLMDNRPVLTPDLSTPAQRFVSQPTKSSPAAPEDTPSTRKKVRVKRTTPRVSTSYAHDYYRSSASGKTESTTEADAGTGAQRSLSETSLTTTTPTAKHTTKPDEPSSMSGIARTPSTTGRSTRTHRRAKLSVDDELSPDRQTLWYVVQQQSALLGQMSERMARIEEEIMRGRRGDAGNGNGEVKGEDGTWLNLG